jgi:hypothetical protein
MQGESKLKARSDNDILLHALLAIATESTDVDSVRIAMIALYETDMGQAFLAANPMRF